VDGLDFFAMYDAAAEAVERARGGGGPSLIHAKLNRYFGHFEGDAMTYRGVGEVEALRRDADPLNFFRKRVTEAGLLEDGQLDEIDASVLAEIDESVVKAKAGAMPAHAKLLTDVYVSY
jgi:TPP-dependent pyruvate/acetoin dehydrogenase alpha subunit